MTFAVALSLVLGAAAGASTDAPLAPEAKAPEGAPRTETILAIAPLPTPAVLPATPAAPPAVPASSAPPGPLRGRAAALGPSGHEGLLGTVSPFLRGAGPLQIAVGGSYWAGEGLLTFGGNEAFTRGRVAVGLGVAEWISLGVSFSGFTLEADGLAGPVLAIGDASFGVLAGGRAGPLAIAGFLDVKALPAVDGFGVAGIGILGGLAAGLELGASSGLPIRITANVAYIRDDVAGYQGIAWTDALRLGYQAHRYGRIGVAGAAEWVTPYVSPGVEVRSAFVIGAPEASFQPPLALSPVLRITPTDRLVLDVGFEFGFNAGVVPGEPPNLPWMFHVGLAYAMEPFREVNVVREIVRENPKDRIHGRVFDAASGRPLGGAIVTLPSLRTTDLATRAESGDFLSPGLEPGLYAVVVQKEGYEPEQRLVTVRKGEQAELELRLKPQPPVSVFKGAIRDEKGTPLAATLLFPEGTVPVQPREAAGTFQLELPPGRYRVEARSIGYLAQGRTLEIRAKETVLFDFVLREVPVNRVAVLSRKEIKISQVIEFEFNKARILPTSYFILDDVVDVLLQHPEVSKLEIAGHTDAIGGEEFNLKLSQGRAASVRDYLIDKGIGEARLAAMGYGLSRPIAPNDTEEGRQRNRRVEFLIVPSGEVTR